MYYIFCKPEPIEIEYTTVAWYITGALMLLEIQREKEGMKLSWYHLEFGARADCKKRLMEETKGLG